MREAVLVIPEEEAGAVIAALGPETRRALPRTETSVESTGTGALLRIGATDTSAMRAALNSYLECIAVTEKINMMARDSK